MVFKKLDKTLLIVLLLWLFAPAAWVLMWKDPKYHSWFAPLLFINGIVIGVMIITQAYIFIPIINSLYRVYGVHPLPFFSSILAVVVVAFCVIQIIYGYHVRKIAKRNKKIVDEHIGIIIFMFSVDVLIGLLTGLIRIIPPYTFLGI